MSRTEDEWNDRFGDAKENAYGSTLFETYGKDLEAVKSADPACVWTVIEGDNDNQYLIPGIHVVNRMGFVIAENPITEAEIASDEWSEVLWFDGAELNDSGPTIY